MITQTKARPVATRAEVIDRLRALEPDIRAFHATALFLFGSTARDELGTDDDIDVFIDYDQSPDGKFSFVELLRLPEYLSDRLGRRVELSTRNGLARSMTPNQIEAQSLRVF